MTWSDILPVPGRITASPWRVCCNAAGGRLAQSLKFSVDPALLDSALTWFRPGQPVRAQLGHAENAGCLRLSPATDGNGHVVWSSGGRAKKYVLCIVIPIASGLAQKSTPVGIDHGDDWIIITLPRWCVQAPGTAPAAPAAPAQKAPFSGIGTTGHAELYAGRRGTTPVTGVRP